MRINAALGACRKMYDRLKIAFHEAADSRKSFRTPCDKSLLLPSCTPLPCEILPEEMDAIAAGTDSVSSGVADD